MTEQFNEGDEVYVLRIGPYPLRKARITRVTKTQAIIENPRYEERFNRVTGRAIGDTWAALAHPNEHLDAEWRRGRADTARRRLRDTAAKDDAAAIRAAFETWDRLAKEAGL